MRSILQRRWASSLTVLALAALFGTGAECVDYVECPNGWMPDDAEPDGCREPDGLQAALTQDLGSGVYGFAHQVLACNGCAGGDCPTQVVGGLDVLAYQAVDVVDSDEACEAPFDTAAGAVPAGVATTAADGAYALRLPPGSYAITAVSPNDGCDFLAGIAEVPAEDIVRVVLFFESF